MIVLESRSHDAKSSVAEVGARSTDENRTSVSRAQSSRVGADGEAAVVSLVAGSRSRSWRHNVVTYTAIRAHVVFVAKKLTASGSPFLTKQW